MHKIQEIDAYILGLIYTYCHNETLDKFMIFITTLGNMGAIWIVIGISCLLFRISRKIGIEILISLIIGALLGNLTIKPLVGRVRPFYIVPDISLLIPEPYGYSFPSGHALSSFAASTVIFLNNKKLGVITLILASIIAFSRLYLYVHYPSDVLVGAFLGIIVGIFSKYILERSHKLKI